MADDYVRRAVEELTRAPGEYFNEQAPEIMQRFARELEKFVLTPLMQLGYTRDQALLIHNGKVLDEIRSRLTDYD